MGTLGVAKGIVDSLRTTPTHYTYGGLSIDIAGPEDTMLGAAHLAASVYARTGDPQTMSWALHLIDIHLNKWQRHDGAIYIDGTPQVPHDIATCETLSVVGRAMAPLMLALPQSQLDELRGRVMAMGDFLRGWGICPYYVNGNIELVKAEAFWHAHVITGEKRFRYDYERQMDFARTAGVARATGWVQTNSISGYFAEYGGGVGMLDWNYTMYQNAILSNLWVATRDPRAYRWLEHTCETLRTRINKVRNANGWELDVSGGSRVGVNQTTGPSWWYYLQTPGFVLIGDVEAADSVGPLLTNMVTDSLGSVQAPGYWRCWGRGIACLLDTGYDL